MPGKVRFAIEGVRALAQQRVDESSLRAVADEIGMSNSGLYSFLRGGEPYSAVRKKLVAWFMAARDTARNPIQPEEVEAAQAVLASYIRQGGTSVREKRFLQISEQIAVDGGVQLSTDAGDMSTVYRKRRRVRRRKG